MTEVNRKMKVFSQLYVGVKTQGRGTEKLGFATPYEDNAQGRKRQETVDTWCRGYDRKTPDTKIVENVPRTGFKITDDVKRVYWGGGNVVFRVYDPYGYELEIQSQNLMALLLVCGIQPGGEIPGRCLWGRDGSTNILLHESSEEFKNAILAAESLKKPKTGKGEEGLEYLLLDGTSAYYVGKRWVSPDDYVEHGNEHARIKIDEHVFEARAYSRGIGEPELYDAVYSAETKVATFYKKAPLISPTGKKMTAHQREVWLDGELRFASAAKKGNIRWVGEEKPVHLRYTTRPITGMEFEKQLKSIGHMRHHFTASTEKSAGQMHFFNDWPDFLILKEGDRLFSSHFDQQSSIFNDKSKSCMGTLDINDAKFTITAGHNSWHRTMPISYQRDAASQALVLPKFRTVDEVIAWCNLCQEKGIIHKLIVTDRA